MATIEMERRCSFILAFCFLSFPQITISDFIPSFSSLLLSHTLNQLENTRWKTFISLFFCFFFFHGSLYLLPAMSSLLTARSVKQMSSQWQGLCVCNPFNGATTEVQKHLQKFLGECACPHIEILTHILIKTESWTFTISAISECKMSIHTGLSTLDRSYSHSSWMPGLSLNSST